METNKIRGDKRDAIVLNIIKNGILYLGILVLICTIFFGSFYTIPAGERGVLLTFGKPTIEAQQEGLHFKVPLAQKIIKMDVKTQKYETDASAASKDLQVVSTKIAVNYHLVESTVPTLYKDIGINYQDRIIQPAVQEVVKASTAQFTAEELITRRPEVKQNIKQLLIDRMESRGIIIEDISITNFDFSENFNSAIEAKVTAEQKAFEAKNKLEQVKYEAEQRITQSQAEAEAIRIQAQAIQAQGGEEYVQLQAISKWDGILPVYTSGAIPFIDVTPNK